MSTEYANLWKNAEPIFLLEINWNGVAFRFATKPTTLYQDGVAKLFAGNLDDPEYVQKSRILGTDVEALAIPMALYFDDIDIAFEYAEGNALDGAICELSYVIAGETDYNARVILATGKATSCIYGHPERPIEYVEFSIESEAFVENRAMIDGVNKTNVIDETTLSFTALGLDDDDIDKRNVGKIIPIAFGRLAKAGTREIFTIPSYLLGKATLLSDWKFTAACHDIISSSFKIIDDNNVEATGNIAKVQDLYARAIEVGYPVNIQDEGLSYATVDISTGMTDPTDNQNIEYWLQIEETMQSPYSNEVLEGGGDLCLWALTISGANVDFDMWYNLRTYLNIYKFAGVIVDETVTGLKWLQQHILPYLPVDIVVSKNGISPRINLLATGVDIPVREKIIVGGDVIRQGPMTPATEPDDIINEVKIRYGWQGRTQSFVATATVGASLPEFTSSFGFLGTPPFATQDEYAVVSAQQYGIKQKTVELHYVYDENTAFRIGRDIIRFFSQPVYTIEYAMHPKHGALQVGEIIELTDDDLHVESQKAQILSKKWNRTHWLFTLRVERNYIGNKKNT